MKTNLFIAVVLLLSFLICGCSKPAQPDPVQSASTPIPSEDNAATDPDQTTAAPTEQAAEIRECFLLDSSNGVTAESLPLSREDVWNDFFNSESAPETMTIEFSGVTYTGTYEYSVYPLRCSYMEHHYKTDDKIEFIVKADTGEFVSINLLKNITNETEAMLEDLDDPEAAAYEIAREYAGQYVDIEDYELLESYTTELDLIGDGEHKYERYRFWFTRPVAGKSTADYVNIEVSSKGHVGLIHLGDSKASEEMIGHEEEILNIDVEGSVREALANVKLLYGEELSGDFEIAEETLVYTPAGERAIFVRVDADLVGYEGMTAGFVFIIYI